MCVWGGGGLNISISPLIQTENGHGHHGQQVKKSHPISRSQNPPTLMRPAGHSGNHAGVVMVSSNSITGIGIYGCGYVVSIVMYAHACTVLCNPALNMYIKFTR